MEDLGHPPAPHLIGTDNPRSTGAKQFDFILHIRGSGKDKDIRTHTLSGEGNKHVIGI